MNDASLLYEKQDEIAWLTLNRPPVLNAINLEMRDLLWSAMNAVRDDPDVRVAVFSGAGDRAFSAGADISEFGTAPSYVEARRARRERDLWGLMLKCPKPLVAAVQGFAFGAGCELSLLCDIRIASDDATFDSRSLAGLHPFGRRDPDPPPHYPAGNRSGDGVQRPSNRCRTSSRPRTRASSRSARAAN